MQKNISILILLSEIHLLTDQSQNLTETQNFVQKGVDSLDKMDQFVDQVLPTLKGVNIGLMSIIEMLRTPKF